MTMNFVGLKKYFAMGLAAVCLSLAFAGNTEAAPVKKHESNKPAITAKQDKNQDKKHNQLQVKDNHKDHDKYDRDKYDRDHRDHDKYDRDKNDHNGKDREWVKLHDKEGRYKKGIHSVDGLYHKYSFSDVIFYASVVPNNHERCTKVSHRDLGKHFHCKRSDHKHIDCWTLCRYDTCRNKHPFKGHFVDTSDDRG